MTLSVRRQARQARRQQHQWRSEAIPSVLLRPTLITGSPLVYRAPAGGLVSHSEVNEERGDTKAARDPPATLGLSAVSWACAFVPSNPACLPFLNY